MASRVRINRPAIARAKARARKRADDLETRKSAVVGIFGPAAAAQHGDSDLTNVEVASRNEFGFGVPERSFIRATFDMRRAQMSPLMRKAAGAAARKKLPMEWALAIVGQKFLDEIIKRINSRIPPPNAPATIAEKGSSTPLIDTGQLKQSIAFKVAK